MKNTYKSLPTKKLSKTDREYAVLIGLIELYLKTGKPIGSNTLQDYGFETLSSATIRNYFHKMEMQGYLKQQHTSGGRIPTNKALRLYADTYSNQGIIEENQEELLSETLQWDNKEIATFLHRSAESFSELTKCAVFLSAPRFDQDFIQDIRLIELDASKILSIIITDFGLIRTEPIYLSQPITPAFLKNCEEYFLWKMNKGEKPLFMNESESKLATRIYNEVIVRHVVEYANFSKEDLFRTGLSKLLAYPEFNDATALSNSLALLENDSQMQFILRECCKQNAMVYWIGDELTLPAPDESDYTVIAIPYRINQITAGAIAILGPTRIPYRNLFGLIRAFSEKLSTTLTSNIYKYKITFRQPQKTAAELSNSSILLENKGLHD